MPYINVSTSARVEDKKKLLEEISNLVSSLTNKSKRFVMARLHDESEMYFEDESLCCFLEIKSIGSINPTEMARPLSNFINEKRNQIQCIVTNLQIDNSTGFGDAQDPKLDQYADNTDTINFLLTSS